jgi:hypothetical protein
MDQKYNIYNKYMQFGEREKIPLYQRLPNIVLLWQDYRCPEFGFPAEFASGLNFTRQMPSCVIPESEPYVEVSATHRKEYGIRYSKEGRLNMPKSMLK